LLGLAMTIFQSMQMQLPVLFYSLALTFDKRELISISCLR
jgi:hypothetical protein